MRRPPNTVFAALLVGVACDAPREAGPTEASAPEGAPAPAPERDRAARPEQAEPAPPEATGDGEAPDAETREETGDPTPAERPEDYGVVKPPRPIPADDELVLHALAGYEVVAIYGEPNLKSQRLGYLRFGQRMMATEKIEDEGEGCKKGFHGLPTGGYACASKGLIVKADKEPYMYLPPPPPRVEEALPYDYGTIGRDGTPMWWRIADADEVRLADEKYAASIEAEAAKAGEPSAKSKSKPKPKPSAVKGDKSPKAAPSKTPSTLPSLADMPPPAPVKELTEAEKKELARKKEEAKKRAEARKKAAEERKAELAQKMARLPLNSSKPFMEKGFTIAISEKVRDKGRSWWRTTRGGFVEAGRAWRRKALDFEGSAIAEGSGFPFGFVMEDRAPAMTKDDKGKLKWSNKFSARQFVDFAEEVEIAGRPYLVTADGVYARKSDVRLAVQATRPESVAPWEPWIDVSLELQMLVAYEGDTPVYATLVSTGKKGTKEESFRTPKGTYRIRSKHISSSMDGNTASDGAYSIQDVPWTMFFEGSYALHGAFWHSRFGRRRSHGCVNLGPTDARWIFNWSTPVLPEGWHGVNASDDAPGTLIVVH